MTPLIGHALLSNFIVNATGNALTNVPGNVGYTPDIDTPQSKAFAAAFSCPAQTACPPTPRARPGNGTMVLLGSKAGWQRKPLDVTKALRGAEVETLYGKATVRPADNQLLIPNYIAREGGRRCAAPRHRAKLPATITPPASPLYRAVTPPMPYHQEHRRQNAMQRTTMRQTTLPLAGSLVLCCRHRRPGTRHRTTHLYGLIDAPASNA